MELQTWSEEWELWKPFRISRGVSSAANIVVAELREGGHRGRGEAAGVEYHGESLAQVRQVMEDTVRENPSLDRESLQDLLPPGGARNALDCALWDLEAKREGCSIWDLVGIEPKSLTTVCTIGIDSPEAMAASAVELARYPVLKIKLDDDGPVERIRAIHDARPDAALIVDANQAWSLDRLAEVARPLAELGVEMIEQPVAEGGDSALIDYEPPLTLCADESCNTLEDLEYLAKRYQMVNIKLDKTGGLTAALELARAAQEYGLELMVGNMLGSSLAMAPAFVIGQMCRYNDLDGPLLQREDREHAMLYDGATVSAPEPELWG